MHTSTMEINTIGEAICHMLKPLLFIALISLSAESLPKTSRVEKRALMGIEYASEYGILYRKNRPTTSMEIPRAIISITL